MTIRRGLRLEKISLQQRRAYKSMYAVVGAVVALYAAWKESVSPPLHFTSVEINFTSMEINFTFVEINFDFRFT